MFKQYLAKQTFLLEYRGLYLTRKHTGLYYMKPEKKKKRNRKLSSKIHEVLLFGLASDKDDEPQFPRN